MKKFAIETNGNGRTLIEDNLAMIDFGDIDNIKAHIHVEHKLCALASDIAVLCGSEYVFPPMRGTKPIKIRLEIEFE